MTIRHAPRGLVERVLTVAARFHALASYDFCPWLNRYVYWLKRPIGWFVVGDLAGLLIGLFLAPQGWFVCGVLTAVMALGVAWPWISMRGLTASLSFDRRRAREGNTVLVRLAVRNRWPWPAWGLVVERGFFGSGSDEDGAPALVALARVPGWSQNEYEFEFQPPRRGIYPRQSPVLATGFPFGIWQSERVVSAARPLVVWPRLIPLTAAPRVGGDRRALAGRFVDRAGSDGEIIAARLYRRGDSLRRVHWAQTARRDALVVCERQSAARQRVRLILDGPVFAGSAPRDGELLDWAVRVTASLCRELHAHQCEVECVLDGEGLVLQPGPAGLQRLLDRLAAYEPQAAPGGLPAASAARDRSLAIAIGRQQGAEAGGASIRGARWVLLEDSRGGRPDAEPGGRPPAVRSWISLDTAQDVGEQLQRQWGKRCHEDWRA